MGFCKYHTFFGGMNVEKRILMSDVKKVMKIIK